MNVFHHRYEESTLSDTVLAIMMLAALHTVNFEERITDSLGKDALFLQVLILLFIWVYVVSFAVNDSYV